MGFVELELISPSRFFYNANGSFLNEHCNSLMSSFLSQHFALMS